MRQFLKTKALLASLAASALAFGTACKSHSSATRETPTTDSNDMGTMSNPNTGTSTDSSVDTTTPPGMGGAGMDEPALTPGTDEAVAPNSVDPNMSAEPGTGGAGDVEPLAPQETDEMGADDGSTLEPGTGGSGMLDPDTRMTPPTPLPEPDTSR